MTEMTREVGSAVARAVEAARVRDGRGRMREIAEELRGMRGDDAEIALSAVEELLDAGNAVRRLEAEGEDAEVARLDAKFNDLVDWLEEMRDELLAETDELR